MSYEPYDAYLLRLSPQDDNGYAYINYMLSFRGNPSVKILSPAEENQVRELLLADGELGKTVGVNGIRGEGYIVLSTFPRMAELHKFFRSVANEGMNYDEFYSLNAKKRAAAAAPKANGGFRRRSLRKSSRRALRKNLRSRRLR